MPTFGTDAEEARDRADWLSGDPARQAQVAEREAERLMRFFEQLGGLVTILDQPEDGRLDVPTTVYGTGKLKGSE